MGKFCRGRHYEPGKQEVFLHARCKYSHLSFSFNTKSVTAVKQLYFFFLNEAGLLSQLSCPEQQQGDETTADECWLAPTATVTSFLLGMLEECSAKAATNLM